MKAKWLDVLIAVLVGMAVGLWAYDVHAEPIYRGLDPQGGAATLKLYEKPCTSAKVLWHLYEQVLDDRRFKAATLFYSGRDWESCWVEIKETVLSIDEDGAPFQAIPRAKFQEEGV